MSQWIPRQIMRGFDWWQMGVGFSVLGALAFIGGCGSDRPPGTTPQAAGPFVPSAELIAQHNRAVALMGQFDYAAAYAALEPLVNTHPDWLDGKIDLAIVTLNRRQDGDSDRATKLLKEVTGRQPTHLRANYCLAILSLDGGDPQSAQKLFQKVADSDPTDGYAQYYAGQCASQLGQVEASLMRFTKAMHLDPYLRSAYYGAFQASLRLGKTAEADQFRREFEQLEGNPQARLAEIKYTRMGPKATLSPIDVTASTSVAAPLGPLFLDGKSLTGTGEPRIPWSTHLPKQAHLSMAASDGSVDLIAVQASADPQRPNIVLRQQSGMREWKWLVDHPLSRVTSVNAVLWGDVDNDGLVDAYLCRKGPNQLWRQTAVDQWRDVTTSSGTAGPDINTVDGQIFDADHDGDLDLFLVNDGFNELLSNNLNGTFRPLGKDQGIEGDGRPSRSLVVLDIDRDRDLDLFVIKVDPPHEVWMNDRLWSYRKTEPFGPLGSSPIEAALAVDRNADGQDELLVLSEGRLFFWQLGSDGVWRSDRALTMELDGQHVAQPISVADINGDGAVEVIATLNGGLIVADGQSGRIIDREPSPMHDWQLANLSGRDGPTLIGLSSPGGWTFAPGPGRFDFLELSFTGKDAKAEQMRSNRSGIGVRAAARRGATWTSIRTLRNDSGPGQDLQPVAVGLAGQSRVDFVSVTWPDGVFQTEIDLVAGKHHLITETQRQVSSCPIVFVWNGREYAFVTDVLGGGGLGFNTGRGDYANPRPQENLLLAGNLVQATGGVYAVKIVEPMEEVCYLDAAQLVQFDLPAGWQMALDERFAASAPEPTGKPLFFREIMRPTTAVNDRGQSVLGALAEPDGVAAEPGPRDPRFIGLTAEHFIDLTFAGPLDQDRLYLLMDGWIEYPYSQTLFAAWQADATYRPPTVQAQDGDGKWHPVAVEFGYPAGMPRQATVPLDRQKLPRGTKRLRVVTNMEIYWDRLAVVQDERPPAMRQQVMPLRRAEAAEVGFPARRTLLQRWPEFDYSRRLPTWDTRHSRGNYSAFGPVNELVAEADDAVAVIGPGEEVHLEFTAIPDMPPPSDVVELPRRMFVLKLSGWCKDMDMYTRDGETVEPLPQQIRHPKDFQVVRRRWLHEKNHLRYRSGN